MEKNDNTPVTGPQNGHKKRIQRFQQCSHEVLELLAKKQLTIGDVKIILSEAQKLISKMAFQYDIRKSS